MRKRTEGGADSPGCCGGVDRREFLKAAGAGVAAASLATPSVILGADGVPVDAGHLVPWSFAPEGCAFRQFAG